MSICDSWTTTTTQGLNVQSQLFFVIRKFLHSLWYELLAGVFRKRTYLEKRVGFVDQYSCTVPGRHAGMVGYGDNISLSSCLLKKCSLKPFISLENICTQWLIFIKSETVSPHKLTHAPKYARSMPACTAKWMRFLYIRELHVIRSVFNRTILVDTVSGHQWRSCPGTSKMKEIELA